METTTTTTALAAAVGVDERTVRRWLARKDWPFGPVPPWDAGDVSAWRTATFPPPAPQTDEIDDQIKRAKLARAVHDARSAKVAADLAEKSVYDAGEVNQDTLRHIYAARNAMLAIGHEAAFELKRLCGVDPEKAEKIIREITRRILADVCRGWSYRVVGSDQALISFDAALTCQTCHLTWLADVAHAQAAANAPASPADSVHAPMGHTPPAVPAQATPGASAAIPRNNPLDNK